MKTGTILAVGTTWLLIAAVRTGAVPAPEGRGGIIEQWEYAELAFVWKKLPDGIAVPPAAFIRGNAASGRRDVQKFAFITATDEVEGQTWEELANKLNAAPGKKDASDRQHKLRVLNKLGSEGWELIHYVPSSTRSDLPTWTFKRKVLK